METIELAIDGRFTITLKGRGTAGYRWEFTVDDPRFVQVERLIEQGDPGMGSVDERFMLTALLAGETVVRFRQVRPFDKSKQAIATREIRVGVRSAG
jgi:hypothetical protein